MNIDRRRTSEVRRPYGIEAGMFFLQRRRRPALARVVRNSNATLWRYGRREYDMEAGADGRTAMTSPMERPSWTDCSGRRAPHAVSSTLDAVLGRVHGIPQSAMSRLSGSPTVYAR